MKIQRGAAAAVAAAVAAASAMSNSNTGDRQQESGAGGNSNSNNNNNSNSNSNHNNNSYLQDTRTHVVGELYDTERSYVESLQILIEKYMKPLKNLESNRAPLIDSNLVDEIFYSIPEILLHHENFLSALQERLSSDWDSSQVIGNVFIEAFTNQQVIDTYTAFINNWKNARHAIKVAIQAKPAFERFLEAMSREHRNKLTLDALLIMPVQRIPRYELLIKELIKHTPDEHPDHGPLIEAQQKIHELALKIDRAEKEMIHQEQLRDLEALIEGHVELQNPQRDFMRYDLVTISASTLTNAKKERVLFLFCDLLIIASVKKKVSRRSNLQAAFSNSTNDISLLEGNKFKLILRISLDQIEVRHDNNNQATQYWHQQQQQQQQKQLQEQQQQQLTTLQCKKLIDDKRQELESDLCLLQQIDMLATQMTQVDRTRLNDNITELADQLRNSLNTLDKQQIDYEANSACHQQSLSSLQHSAQLVQDSLYLIESAAPISYQVTENQNQNQNNLDKQVYDSDSNLNFANASNQQQQQQLIVQSSSCSPNDGSEQHYNAAAASSTTTTTTTNNRHFLASNPTNTSSVIIAPGNNHGSSSSTTTTTTTTSTTTGSAAQQTDATIEFIISNSVPINGRDSNNHLSTTSVISELGEQLPGGGGLSGSGQNMSPMLDSNHYQQQQQQQQLSLANFETLVVTFASKDRRQAFLQAFLEAKQQRFNQIHQKQQQQQQQQQQQHRILINSMQLNSSSSNNTNVNRNLSHPADVALIKSKSIASDMRRARLKHQDEVLEMRLSDSCVRTRDGAEGRVGSTSGSGCVRDKRFEDRNSSAPSNVGTIVHQMSAPQVLLTGTTTAAAAAATPPTTTSDCPAANGCNFSDTKQQLRRSHHCHHHHQLIHQPASQPALLHTICCHDQHNDDNSTARLLLNKSDQMINLTDTTIATRPATGGDAAGGRLLINCDSKLANARHNCRSKSMAHDDTSSFDSATDIYSNQTQIHYSDLNNNSCGPLTLTSGGGGGQFGRTNFANFLLELAPKFLLAMPIDFLHTQQPALQFTCALSRSVLKSAENTNAAGQAASPTRSAPTMKQKVSNKQTTKYQTISDNSGQLFLCMSNGYVSHVALLLFVKKPLSKVVGADYNHGEIGGNGQANDQCYTIVPLIQSSGDICKSQINCAAQVSWPAMQIKKPVNGSASKQAIGESKQLEPNSTDATNVTLCNSLDKRQQQQQQQSQEQQVDTQTTTATTSEADESKQQRRAKTPSFSIKAASPPVNIVSLRKASKDINCDNDSAHADNDSSNQSEWNVSKSAPSNRLLGCASDANANAGGGYNAEQLNELFKRVGSSSQKDIIKRPVSLDRNELKRPPPPPPPPPLPPNASTKSGADTNPMGVVARRMSRDNTIKSSKIMNTRPCQRAISHRAYFNQHHNHHQHHSHDQLRSRNNQQTLTVSGHAACVSHNDCSRCHNHHHHHHHHQQQQQQQQQHLFHNYHHYHNNHHHNHSHSHSHNPYHGHSHHHGHIQHHANSSGQQVVTLLRHGNHQHQHQMYFNKHHTVPLGELRKALERQTRILDGKDCAGDSSSFKQQRHLVPPRPNTPCQLESKSLDLSNEDNEDQEDDAAAAVADSETAEAKAANRATRMRKKIDKKARSATPPARYVGSDTDRQQQQQQQQQQQPQQHGKSFRSARLLRHQASLKTSSILAKLVGTATGRGSSYLRAKSRPAAPIVNNLSDKLHSDQDDTDTDAGNQVQQAISSGSLAATATATAPRRDVDSSSNDSNSVAYGNNLLQIFQTASNPNVNGAIVSPLSSVSSLTSTNSSMTVNSACASSPNRSACNIHLIDQQRLSASTFCCPLIANSQFSSAKATSSNSASNQQQQQQQQQQQSFLQEIAHEHDYKDVNGTLASAMLRERSATVPCRAYCDETTSTTMTEFDNAIGGNPVDAMHGVCPITLMSMEQQGYGNDHEGGAGSASKCYKVSDIICDTGSKAASASMPSEDNAGDNVDLIKEAGDNARAKDLDDNATAAATAAAIADLTSSCSGAGSGSITSLWLGCDDGSLVVIDCMADLTTHFKSTLIASDEASACNICDYMTDKMNKSNSDSGNNISSSSCQNVHSEVKLPAPISDIKNYNDKIVFVALANGQLAVFSRQVPDEQLVADNNNNNSNNNNNAENNANNSDTKEGTKDCDNCSSLSGQQCRQWSLANPQILTITQNELNLTSKLCLVCENDTEIQKGGRDDNEDEDKNDHDDGDNGKVEAKGAHLWYSYGRNVFVLDIQTLKLITTIMTPTNDKAIQFAIQSITIDTMELVRHLNGIWIAFKSSPLIQLYDYTSYKLLLEISLLEPINKILSYGNEIIRQHKTTCLGTTSLLNIYNEHDNTNSLFVGTSAGIIIYLSVNDDQLKQQIVADKSVWNPQVISLRHGHSGQVRFMRLIDLSEQASSTRSTTTSTTNDLAQQAAAAAAIDKRDADDDDDGHGGDAHADAHDHGTRSQPLLTDSKRQDNDDDDDDDDEDERYGDGACRGEEEEQIKRKKNNCANLYLVSGGAGIDLYGPDNSQQVVQHLSGDEDHLNHLILWQL